MNKLDLSKYQERIDIYRRWKYLVKTNPKRYSIELERYRDPYDDICLHFVDNMPEEKNVVRRRLDTLYWAEEASLGVYS